MVVGEALEAWDREEVLLYLSELLGMEKIDLILNPDTRLRPEDEEKFLGFVARRKEGYPLQYILGKGYFYDFEVFIEPGVLIPRPETELLVEEALKVIGKGDKVLELGTGSGVIAIALAKHSQAQIRATDISQKALALARKNASHNKVDLDLVQSDLFENVSGTYDLIISNPPYISEKDRPSLARELAYEPDQALFSGPDGLDIIRRIIAQAPSYLRKGGSLILEIAYNQGEILKKLFKKSSFKDIMIMKDYNGHDRIAKGNLC